MLEKLLKECQNEQIFQSTTDDHGLHNAPIEGKPLSKSHGPEVAPTDVPKCDLGPAMEDQMIEGEDLKEDEMEEIGEADLKKFEEFLNLKHSVEELQKMIDKQPIRVAQRLLRLYGDKAETEVYKVFPDTLDRDKLVTALSKQRKRYEDQQWSKYGIVRTY